MTAWAEGCSTMDRIKYTISKGFSIFFENLRGNFISIITISTLLFFYLAVFSVNYSASKAIDKLTDIKTIRIFLEEGVGKEEMIKRLSALQMPASFQFYDKHQSKQRVLNLMPGAKNIEKLPEDLFPTFIEMRIADYAAVDGLVTDVAVQVEKIGGVRTVEYGKRVSEKLTKVKKTSFIFMFFISGLTGISAAVIIFNTIRLSLYRFQRKIMIYRLVGATKMFITAPYLFAAFIEAGISFMVAAAANILFIEGVKSYLLKESYFLLFTPSYPIYALFYALLTFTAVISAFFCVYSFLIRLKSVNEA